MREGERAVSSSVETGYYILLSVSLCYRAHVHDFSLMVKARGIASFIAGNYVEREDGK